MQRRMCAAFCPLLLSKIRFDTLCTALRTFDTMADRQWVGDGLVSAVLPSVKIKIDPDPTTQLTRPLLQNYNHGLNSPMVCLGFVPTPLSLISVRTSLQF